MDPGGEQLGQKAATFRSWNRMTYVALVRYQSPLFQDQLQTPHVGVWLAVRWLIARVGTYQVWCSTRSAMHSSSMM